MILLCEPQRERYACVTMWGPAHLDLHVHFAVGKLFYLHLAEVHAEVVRDLIAQLWVRAAGEDLQALAVRHGAV